MDNSFSGFYPESLGYFESLAANSGKQKNPCDQV